MTIDVRPVGGAVRNRARLVARHEGVSWTSLAEAKDLDLARRCLPDVDGGLLLLSGGAAIDDRRALAGWARRVRLRATAVLLYGPAADAMATAIGVGAGCPMVVRCADALDASITAARLAEDGDTILLCPGRPTEIDGPEPSSLFASVAMHPEEAIAAPAVVEAA